MKILFLDQSGKPGGAELCLIDIAKPYRDSALVGLFADGPFRHLLEQQQISVQVLATQPLQVRKESSWVKGLGSLGQLAPMIARVALLSRDYDLIYANTQKALVVGALASFFSRRCLVYHLHDILSADHFSRTNRRLAVTLANRASLVIANSKASQAAFVAAGGRSDITEVVYNGFEPEFISVPDRDSYSPSATISRMGEVFDSNENRYNFSQLRQQMGLDGRFLVGHFSRLSPWKGQHILLEALAHCPNDVAAIFVGEALFGEQDYVKSLHEQVTVLGLEERVRFLGFRSDVVPLMKVCDLIAHTSTAPEPFGRVIVEAMLCGRPVVAAQSGGAIELVETGQTGWLVPPGEPLLLAEAIATCRNQPEQAAIIARQAQIQASQRFQMSTINQQIAELLSRCLP